MKTFKNTFILILMILLASGLSAKTLKVGDKVESITIMDANNKPIIIPDLGKKMVLIFYPDPDNAKGNKEFSDAMKKTDFPLKYFMCMGIVNLKDAPIYPDWLLRIVIRRELATHHKAVIYTDPDRRLAKAWGMGDCNNKFVVILIDQNRRVLLYKKTRMTRQEIEWAVQTIASHVRNALEMAGEVSRTASAE